MRLATVEHEQSTSAARLDGDDYVLLPFRDVGELLSHPRWRSAATADGDRIPASALTLGEARATPQQDHLPGTQLCVPHR